MIFPRSLLSGIAMLIVVLGHAALSIAGASAQQPPPSAIAAGEFEANLKHGLDAYRRLEFEQAVGFLGAASQGSGDESGKARDIAWLYFTMAWSRLIVSSAADRDIAVSHHADVLRKGNTQEARAIRQSIGEAVTDPLGSVFLYHMARIRREYSALGTADLRVTDEARLACVVLFMHYSVLPGVSDDNASGERKAELCPF